MDIILGDSATADDTFARVAHGMEENVIASDKGVFDVIKETSTEQNIKVHVGTIGSGKVFYATVEDDYAKFEKDFEIIAGEMESIALFANPKALGKQAGCLLTVSDSHFKPDTNLSAEARQNAFNDMMVLALESALKILD
jgi:purine-nucleoside phosphorylase